LMAIGSVFMRTLGTGVINSSISLNVISIVNPESQSLRA
jgi:hypothetical protein